MLSLDSPRWAELEQAYGSAEDIPRLIEALAREEDEDARSELWLGVWATLSPQAGGVNAAYAVVPHLLDVVRSQNALERLAALHFATRVELSRQSGGAPPIPHDLVAAYAVAIESMPERVHELTQHPWDTTTAQILAAALLVGKRQPVLARELLREREES